MIENVLYMAYSAILPLIGIMFCFIHQIGIGKKLVTRQDYVLWTIFWFVVIQTPVGIILRDIIGLLGIRVSFPYCNYLFEILHLPDGYIEGGSVNRLLVIVAVVLQVCDLILLGVVLGTLVYSTKTSRSCS
jgi:hypothetical protein